jgi:hypothetical protein
MSPLLKEIRHNPLLWLLVFVPVVFAAATLRPEAHALLFVLSVLAIVPLAALLSHGTEAVAAKRSCAAGNRWRRRRPSSSPFIPGSETSTMAHSGWNVSASARALGPSAATATS